MSDCGYGCVENKYDWRCPVHRSALDVAIKNPPHRDLRQPPKNLTGDPIREAVDRLFTGDCNHAHCDEHPWMRVCDHGAQMEWTEGGPPPKLGCFAQSVYDLLRECQANTARDIVRNLGRLYCQECRVDEPLAFRGGRYVHPCEDVVEGCMAGWIYSEYPSVAPLYVNAEEGTCQSKW